MHLLGACTNHTWRSWLQGTLLVIKLISPSCKPSWNWAGALWTTLLLGQLAAYSALPDRALGGDFSLEEEGGNCFFLFLPVCLLNLLSVTQQHFFTLEMAAHSSSSPQFQFWVFLTLTGPASPCSLRDTDTSWWVSLQRSASQSPGLRSLSFSNMGICFKLKV